MGGRIFGLLRSLRTPGLIFAVLTTLSSCGFSVSSPDWSIKEVSIPGAFISSLTPSFEFSLSGTPPLSGKWTCRLDGGEWAPCSTSFTLDELTEERAYQLEVRFGQDGNQKSTKLSWVVDTTVPVVSISAGPAEASSSKQGRPLFEFSSLETGSGVERYECRINEGAWQSCTDAHRPGVLSVGPALLSVRAIDRAGNQSASVGRSWNVERVEVAFESLGNYVGTSVGPRSLRVVLEEAQSYDVEVGYAVNEALTNLPSPVHSLNAGLLTIPSGQTEASIAFNVLSEIASSEHKRLAVSLNMNGIAAGNARLGPMLTYRAHLDGGASSSTFEMIASGLNHSCGIVAVGEPHAGRVKCWGSNGSGRLGDGSTTERLIPTLTTDVQKYAAIAAGEAHVCGIVAAGEPEAGRVKCWGYNGEGQVGDGTGVDKLVPTLTVDTQKFVAISAGGVHSCGIVAAGETEVGRVKCWGYNSEGQVGDGTGVDKLVPTLTVDTQKYIAIFLGGYHGCGIVASGEPEAGRVKCWGYNAFGQLGDGTEVEKLVPTLTTDAQKYAAISANENHGCGIVASSEPHAGRVKCWGYNGYGQLGDGTTTSQTAPTLTTDAQKYVSVSAGGVHSCGIIASGELDAGRVKCWGKEAYVGDGTTTNRLVPTLTTDTQKYLSISAGGIHSCGIVANGELDAGRVKCWGYNGNAQLGDGTTIYKPAPTPTTDTQKYDAISAGASHSCGIVASGELDAGRMKCWGRNNYGQIGDGTTTSQTVPTHTVDTQKYAAISGGGFHSCGIVASSEPEAGRVKCWGDNGNAQLGDGTTTNRLVPTLTTDTQKYVSISAGASQTCGIVASGEPEAGRVKCWGYNGNAALGDSTTTNRLVSTLTTDTQKYVSISAGGGHSCGIVASGELDAGRMKCWGRNNYGQVGDGTTTNRLVPTLTTDTQKYVSISAGASHSCGIVASGEPVAGRVKCWGRNNYGQTGDGTTTSQTVPTLNADIQQYASIAVGEFHTCGTVASGELDAGRMKCWGRNNYGQLGDGTTTSETVPTCTVDTQKYAAISANGSHSCGIVASSELDAGRMKCWGFNGDSQVGTGDTTVAPIPMGADP